jgi:serine/threonine protein kinase
MGHPAIELKSSAPVLTVVPPEGAARSAGRHAGPYRLTDTLGAGAMGKVFVGEHVLLGRKAAIKVMRSDLAEDRRFIKRFISEGRAAACVEHPNVVKVTDMARDPDGTTWLAMELLEGCDLSALIGDPDLTLRRAVSITRQLCLGLAAVHAHGIVHRDVKPGNVFITPSADGDVVTLLDFGIARLQDEDAGDEDVEQGLLIGTPAYMAPEQAKGLCVDERCDIYSTSAVLYELITGRPMFERGSVEELVSAAIFATPPPLGRWVSLPEAVRAELESLIAECGAKRPAERPCTASDVAARLARIEARLAHEPESATTSGVRSYERIVVRSPARLASTSPLTRRGSARPGARGLVRLAAGALWLGLTWSLATTQTVLDVERAVVGNADQLSAAVCYISAAVKR